MALSHTEKLSIEGKGLQNKLLTIQSLIFILPFLIISYVFYKNNVFLDFSQMVIFALVLVLVLAGFIVLRQIFNGFIMMTASIKKAVAGDKYLMEIREDTHEMHEMAVSFNNLMKKFEETTTELRLRVFELFSIKELIETASKSLDIDDLLNILLEKAMAVSRAKIGSVFMVESERRRFRILASRGPESLSEKDSYIDINESLARFVVSDKKPLLVQDIETDSRTHKPNDPKYGPPSFLSMPILIREDLVAVLNLAHKETSQVFDSTDMETLSIMIGEIGFAVENAQLHSKVKEHLKNLQKRTKELTIVNDQIQKEIIERNRAEEALQKARDELERRVKERTADLLKANEQLKREVGERKRAEESLRKSEASLAEAQRIAHLGNWDWDIENDELSWSEETYRIFGLKPQEFGATYEAFLNSVHPGDREFVVKSVDETLYKKKPYSIDHRIILPDGTERIVHKQAEVIFDETGRAIRMIGTVQDITEYRLAQDEKAKLEAQLMQAHKMESIGTLAGGIAHDFNNILQAISGYSQILLMEKDQSDPDYNKLEGINQSALRASDLTKRLLIFGRKVESELRPVDLNQEVMQVSKILERTIPKMISMEFHLSEDLIIVNADPVQLEQIVMNLGINARDAMPDGGKLIFETEKVDLDEEYCRAHPGAGPGEYFLLSVSDTGHGMEKDILEHIFEPFYTTKGIGKGTGLGLAMVYGIVKSHGGYIMCYSEPGQGTTFKIYFPVLKAESIEQREERKEENIPGGRETILLVDDEETILDIGKNMLERFGYTTVTAESGERAIEVFEREKEHIDLVILDVGMPGMGGYRCLMELLEIDPKVKVIIASGYSASGEVRETLASNAAGFIGKPFQFADILKKLREVLDKS